MSCRLDWIRAEIIEVGFRNGLDAEGLGLAAPDNFDVTRHESNPQESVRRLSRFPFHI